MRALLPILTLIALLLAGCNNATDSAETTPPQPITDNDICHVCGMFITEFEGPKSQAFMENHSESHKFCSTLEMFVFLQQPENQTQLLQAYVHDMGVTPWTAPEDDAFILAADAWYVVGHDQRGSMGHTLAPFSTRELATQFIQIHGGELLVYDDINLELLGQLGRRGESGHTTH